MLIRDGIQLARSIDDFLDMHRSSQFVVTYGKVAIVKSILEAEQSSKLYFNRFKGETFDIAKLADTWLIKFMQMLGPGIPFEEIHSLFSNVSFVVFNYDRCIEFFLGHALQRLYGIDEAFAKTLLASLSIIHPYGVIAPSIEFGSRAMNYLELTNGIKTYTEQVRDEAILTSIAEQVEAARHIVFLGFAYHDQNLALLKPATKLPRNKRIFGTAYRMSDADVNVVRHQLAAWFQSAPATAVAKDISIENKLTCAGMFDDYAKSLTSAE
jgi:hypothetical protein